MDGALEKRINGNERTLNHEGPKREIGSTNTFPKDVHGSTNDPFVFTPSPHPSANGFPSLSGNDRTHAPRSDFASDLWSQGVAELRALDACSNGNMNLNDSTALIKEPGNPPIDIDTAGSAPTYSRDQLNYSLTPSFLESNGNPAYSSGVDHLPRPMPNASVAVSDETLDHENARLRSASRKLMEILASGVRARSQLSEPEAPNRCGTISANASKSPTRSRGGKGYDSLTGADAVSLHAAHAESTVTSHQDVEHNLTSLAATAKPKPAIPTGPRHSNMTNSHPRWGRGCFLPKQGRSSFTPPKPSQVPKDNSPASTKAPSHFSGSRSITPITPIRHHGVWHPRSLSAEAPAFQPSPPSNSRTTPSSSYSKGHGRSISIGTGRSNPRYVSIVPNTPLGPRSLLPPRQDILGTPSIPLESGVFTSSRATSQLFVRSYYPEPHQHTPEGEGQRFHPQGSMAPQPPAQLSDYIGVNVPYDSPSSSLHIDIDTLQYNAQVREQGEQNAEYSQTNHFDSYATSQNANTGQNAADLHQNGNMYSQDTNGYGPRYYPSHTDLSHQVKFFPLRRDRTRLIKPSSINISILLWNHNENPRNPTREMRKIFLSLKT